MSSNGPRTAAVVLDGFLASIEHEDLRAPSAAWGEESRSSSAQGREEGTKVVEVSDLRFGVGETADHSSLDAKAEVLRSAKAVRGSRPLGECDVSCAREPWAPEPVHVATPRFFLGGSGRAPPLEELLDQCLAKCAEDALDAPASPWAGKVGYSIYDEEALLGPYVDMGEDEDLYDDLESETEDDEEGEALDGPNFWDELFDEVEDEALPGLNAYALESVVPRAARAIQPLCCVLGLSEDLPERCPICLEGLACGQQAWRLPCMHVFHEVCMIRYLGTRRSRALCPTCRCDIKTVAASSPMEICAEAHAAP